MPPILGIDVAKEKVDVVLLREGQRLGGQFDNTPSGFAKLVRWLNKHAKGTVHACLEATGHYGEAIAVYLYKAGHVVSVINPAQIKAYGQSMLQRNKTDQMDALVIAAFCRAQQPPAWAPPDAAWRELQAMARHLDALQSNLQQERNRLTAELPSTIVIDTIQAHITFLESQIEALKQQMHDHLDQHAHLKQQRDLLTSIPGIGDLTAAKLLAEIQDIAAFDSAEQLVA